MDQQATKSTQDNTSDVIILKMADSKVPEFKETKNRDYVRYGPDNNYGSYLVYLFNKSAKHNAIINGKVFYIFGKGFGPQGQTVVNRLNESLDDIAMKCIIDLEIFGGYRIEVVYNMQGRICEYYHVPFSTLRVDKNGGYWYKEEWKSYDRAEDAVFINEFNPYMPYGSQIYAYDEYRPEVKFYPLPTYLGANNYIETDIEISKYYLSGIRNGMVPSKMIQFFDGEPSEVKKKEIERRFKDKFTGSENAGNIILVFGKSKDKSVQIDDLSATDLDKQFIEMNKTCQQEIFSAHLVTSPMLFGILTEGQLGGSTQLSISYAIFQNTYAKPKAETFSKNITFLSKFSIWPGQYQLQPTDPVGIHIDIKDVLDMLPKAFVYEKIGVPKELWQDADVVKSSTPGAPGAIVETNQTKAPVNDNVKNLTAKQHQQLLRIIRQYSKGQITLDVAKTLLRTGLDLSDEDINSLLGVTTEMSADMTDDDVIAIFDSYGDVMDDYEILKSKKVYFSSDYDMEDDESVFIKEAFSEYDVTATEAKIIELIKKDKLIPVEVIAKTIGQTVALVKSKIDSLVKRGYIEVVQAADGAIEMLAVDSVKLPPVKINKQPLSKVSIKYSYSGPKDDRNRPFCAKLLELNRLYTRADIERISEKLGYSVFERRGGFWRHKDGTITPYCRHVWKSNIVIKK